MMAYFDCFSGISGDMTLGAFIDLGVPGAWLLDTLQHSLGMDDFDIRVASVTRSGITARQLDVIATDGTHRNYEQIRQLISDSALSDRVKTVSLSMFDRLADAEAAIHGCDKADVHFHEVGGVDAIVDMVGAALCVEYLDIRHVFASKVPVGSGMVDCHHGRLPVPAPATIALLSGVPVYDNGVAGELVTPTGAAILTTLAEGYDALPDMIVDKVGYGAGRRETDPHPNLLRIITGQIPGDLSDTVVMVETGIDDMNPEIFGYLTDRLFAAGALDVSLVPAYMKKGRPGTLLQVLCCEALREKLIALVLSESTSIGVRYYPVKRRVLERKPVTIETVYGAVPAKAVRTSDGRLRVTPEYSACRSIAEEKHLPIRMVYEAVLRQCDAS